MIVSLITLLNYTTQIDKIYSFDKVSDVIDDNGLNYYIKKNIPDILNFYEDVNTDPSKDPDFDQVFDLKFEVLKEELNGKDYAVFYIHKTFQVTCEDTENGNKDEIVVTNILGYRIMRKKPSQGLDDFLVKMEINDTFFIKFIQNNLQIKVWFKMPKRLLRVV